MILSYELRVLINKFLDNESSIYWQQKADNITHLIICFSSNLFFSLDNIKITIIFDLKNFIWKIYFFYFIKSRHALDILVPGECLYTSYPSAPVRCTPVASLADNFAEIVSPVPNYTFSAKWWKNLLPQSQRNFISIGYWEISGPHWIRTFSLGS